ncbi:phage minor head protein [Methanobrevibacter sp.]|uniref:phage minor head protein n=1 Tax=Methanobrevibacter sp. TaxID=66852 RepID=UPI003868514A
MTTLTSKAVKKQLLASKTNALRSLNLEKALEYDLNKFFQNLKTQVLAALYEYYPMDEQGILLQGQADLILAPIFESQKEYYKILERYNKKEYRSGVRQAKRLVKLAKANVSARKSENTTNFNANNLIKIEKDNLFGTNDWTEEKLLKQSFTASEHTMNRVDKDINKILSDGYASGAGIKKVASNIEKRFNQLKTWEARRIARTEIHNAHEMGTMNTYQEMDVEYTQWSSAHDSRVRGLKPKDKANHVKMDGEIIPLGGTYSNGLQYPGDTKGPIYEWINCRCGNLPFIMPYGYIAPPGKAQFREKDLVQTLDYWNQDDLIAQATSEMRETVPNEIDSVMTNIKRSSNEWDINRLTPQEKEMYLKQKKNYTILKNAMENKDYSKLDELEDMGGYYAIRDKKSFLEYTDNGKDFDLWLKDELDDYLEELKDYEKIIKDTNIKVDINPRNVKWDNPDLKDYRILNEDGNYVNVNMEEKFIKYHFKDENLTIFESVDMDTSRVRFVYESYKKLPKHLKNTKEIVLSSQKPRIVNFWGSDSYVGGYVTPTKGSTRIVQFKKTVGQLNDNLVHESAHLLEKDKNFYISNSKEYILAFKKDQQRLLKQGYSLEESYVTPYAHDFTEEFVTKRTLAIHKYGDRQYSEDFAESVKMYLKDKKAFTEKYPNKAKVIEKAIKGKYTTKNTTPYNSWFKSEQNRFKLTEKEWERENLLKFKPDLTSSEMRELEYFDDKRKLDYIYNKKIKGEILDDNLEKAFQDLTKKWEKKLKLPKENILELSDNTWTKEDDKRLKELLKKEQNKKLKILEEGELIDLREKKKLFDESKQLTKKSSKFAFAREDKLKYDELQILKQEGKLKGMKNRKALELLENQKELDSLHAKLIKKGKLSSKEAERYAELYNNKRIQRKFNLNLLEGTAKLEGKTISPVIKEEPYTGDMNDPKNIKKFKGTTKDGMLPGNESIDRYFTKNVATTGKHDEIIEKWVYDAWYNDAQFYHNELQWDEKKLRKWVKKEFKELTTEEQEVEIQNILNEWKQFKELMKDGELKKNMLLHRTQRKLHGWPNPKVGQKVTINADRSFSISKEGVDEYRKGGKKGWWNIELEAPAKTKGVYISPKAISEEHNNKYIRQMEVIVGPDTPAEIIYIDPSPDKKLIRLRAIVE